MVRGFVAVAACVLASMFPGAASGETPPSLAGTWNVTTRMPGNVITEQWVIQQKGATITATAKSTRGEMPVSITDGSHQYKVRATVDGDTMDGSVTRGVGEEYPWHAIRPKTK